jgi:CHAT domain-containing protein
MGATGKSAQEAAATKALEYAELNKARVFSSSWGLVFLDGLKKQVPADLREQERLLSSKKITLQAESQDAFSGKGTKAAAEAKSSLDAVARQQTLLVEQLRKVAPQYASVRYPQRVAMAHIPLHENELLIEFKVLQDAVLVWMLRGTSRGGELVGFYKVGRSRQWFEQQIESIRSASNSGHPERFDPRISEELFSVLFPGHFSEALTGAREVIVIPDDVLFLLPLELLSPTARQGKYVLLSTATDYFPSAAAFMLSRSKVEREQFWRQQFIGIGDPITSSDDQRYIAAKLETDVGATTAASTQNHSNDRGISIDRIRSGGIELERIPETATEIEGIASLFSTGSGATEIRTGVNATKKGLLQTDLSQFRFVHLATHGILPVEASISEPALVFSYSGPNQEEMLLYLSEVVRLKLNSDMVVLSACNTGSGKVTKAEGVASLGTAFLAAGASSVTVSLWQVSDSSTAVLMQEFYRNLLNGKSKSTALAAARAALAAKGYNNPFFWAPFVLTGE